MTVPSKSKNAPTAGPRGRASTSASSCSSVHAPSGRARFLVRAHGSTPTLSRRAAASSSSMTATRRDDVAHLGRPLLPPAGQLLAARVDQVEVAGQLQRAGEQLPRQRLRPVQPALQQHLLADPAALGEELGLDHRRARVARREPLGHHQLRVDERAQHPVRHQQRRPAQHLAAVGGLPAPGRAARARRRSAPGRRRARGRRTRTSAGRAAASPRPSGPPGSRSSTSSAIARSTKWWMALLR